MTIAVAHARGLLDFDQPVAHYWPEHAQSGKAHITVRQLLSHQAGLSAGGKELGIGAKTLEALTAPAKPPTEGLLDQVLQIDSCFSLGYLKPFPNFRFGRSERSFGTPGFGGSFGFADPDAQIGFAYAPNRCGFYIFGDPRETALRETVYACVSRLEAQR